MRWRGWDHKAQHRRLQQYHRSFGQQWVHNHSRPTATFYFLGSGASQTPTPNSLQPASSARANTQPVGASHTTVNSIISLELCTTQGYMLRQAASAAWPSPSTCTLAGSPSSPSSALSLPLPVPSRCKPHSKHRGGSAGDETKRVRALHTQVAAAEHTAMEYRPPR
jgi:hypothetical protein